jgi:DNA-binding transcriptional ArsR family regulator
MSESGQDLLKNLLHPVRMRLLSALAESEGMTSHQLNELLRDIPTASLYRQISRLAKAGLIQVVEERPVRGTLEKVYVLNRSSALHLGQAEMEGVSKEDHLRFFTAFTLTLVDQFSRYLARSQQPDLEADGVGYTQVALYMSDAEMGKFSRALNQALMPYSGSAPGRKKRIFSTVLLPEESAKESDR